MRKTGILESSAAFGISAAAGAVVLLISLLQLPLSVFLQNTRPGLPMVIKSLTKEGLLITPLPGAAPTPLQEYDVVTSIGGVPTDSASFDPASFPDLVMNLQLGDTLRVELTRSGRQHVFDIMLDEPRSVTHGAFISFSRYLTIAVGPLVIMLIAMIVLMRRPRTRQATLYLLLSVAISVYFLTFTAMGQSMPWWKILRPVSMYLPTAGIIMFVPLLLHFLLVFPEERKVRGSAILRNAMIYGPYVLLLLLMLPLIPGLQLPDTELTAVLVNYIFIAGGPLLGVVVLLWSLHKAAQLITKKVLRAILTGILSFAFSIAVSVTLGLFGEELGVPAAVSLYGQIILTAFVVFSLPVAFGYAILRYGFLDVRVIFRRTTVYAFTAAAVSLFFLALYFLLEIMMTGFGRTELLFLSATLTGVFVVVLSLLHERIRFFIDAHVFREEYRTSVALRELARDLVNTLQRDVLLTTLTQRLPKILGARASALSIDEPGDVSLLAGGDTQLEHFSGLMRNPEFRRRLDSEEIVTANSIPGVPYHPDAGIIFQIALQNGEYVAVSLSEKNNGRPFTDGELGLLRIVADHASLCWKNTALAEELKEQERMRQEMEIAHTIQESMLPRQAPEIRGVDIAAMSAPAREVGGDFFDFVHTADGLPGIVIGDGSDKGVSAAMVMSSAISTVRFASGLEVSPREILSRANARLHVDTRSHMFVAVFLGILDADRLALRFTNAGLPKPLLLRGEQAFEIEWSDNGLHLPLGARPDTTFHEQELELDPGDILLLFTDGVIESCNTQDEEFGVKRLRDAAFSVADDGAERIKQHIFDELRAFTGRAELHDDLTLVVMKFD